MSAIFESDSLALSGRGQGTILKWMKNKFPIGEGLKNTLSDIYEGGGVPYIVGGAVRDWMLGITPKDIDLEVYGVETPKLEKILSKNGAVDFVGSSFGVYKMRRNGDEFDISLPRKDSKTGAGHAGFDVGLDPFLSPEEASRRRDFTVNSMFYDPIRESLFDPHGGKSDLSGGMLRHTSEAFSEDPLRVLRAVQFSARFGFELHPDTAELCRWMGKRGGFEELPSERVLEEVKKFVVKGVHHVKGFSTWDKTGWLDFFPELSALKSTKQDRLWHPEGDVLTHTALALQALHKIPRFKDLDPNDKFVVGLGVLCHDMGKATTTKEEWNPKHNRTVVTSHNHHLEGVEEGRRFLERIGVGDRIKRKVEGLVRFHMDHIWTRGRRATRKLARELFEGGRGLGISTLALVVEADHSGRTPLPGGLPETMKKIISCAEKEGCLHRPPDPLISGKDLLGEGIPNGKIMGLALRAAYDFQIEGGLKTRDEAIRWVKGNILRIGKGTVKPLFSGRDLQDLGCEPGPIFGEVLNRSYLLQLAGEEVLLEDLLKKVRRGGSGWGDKDEKRGGSASLSKMKAESKNGVSLPHDAVSRN